MMRADDVPEKDRVYRLEVEVTDIATGSSRRFPLTCHSIIAVVPSSRRARRGRAEGAAARPSNQKADDRSGLRPVELMRFEDGNFVLQAATWEDFRAQLRDRYPDERFERRIHVQRDREAEVRRERAINSLATIIADAVVDEWLREHRIRPAAHGPGLYFSTAP